jgi:hypothetical protein
MATRSRVRQESEYPPDQGIVPPPAPEERSIRTSITLGLDHPSGTRRSFAILTNAAAIPTRTHTRGLSIVS